MRRGDLLTVVTSRDFGNPRPALIIQSDLSGNYGSITVLLISSSLVEAPLIRLTVQPSLENGLRNPSQIMVDKAMTIKRSKLGEPFGRLDEETMVSVNRALALFLGFA